MIEFKEGILDNFPRNLQTWYNRATDETRSLADSISRIIADYPDDNYSIYIFTLDDFRKLHDPAFKTFTVRIAKVRLAAAEIDVDIAETNYERLLNAVAHIDDNQEDVPSRTLPLLQWRTAYLMVLTAIVSGNTQLTEIQEFLAADTARTGAVAMADVMGYLSTRGYDTLALYQALVRDDVSGSAHKLEEAFILLQLSPSH